MEENGQGKLIKMNLFPCFPKVTPILFVDTNPNGGGPQPHTGHSLLPSNGPPGAPRGRAPLTWTLLCREMLLWD